MAVRNFWVNANIDGRETGLCGGPRAKDGGMTINIMQRNNGEIIQAAMIKCFVREDGTLCTQVWNKRSDRLAMQMVTDR